MHEIRFIQDLATIMAIAGAVTILFHRFRQPVVLGYIVAGIIIGPHTPPFGLIHDQHTIETLAELGVVFLMFSLGLEFHLKKLARVGATALIAAVAEIALMLWIGYGIGRYFGWGVMDSLFLGAILGISSTTIIVKALDDLGMKGRPFAQIIFGILIVEDILGIGMIALLSALATSGSLDAGAVVGTLGKLVLFLIVSLVLGILVVPRILDYVARFRSNEMILVTVLGLLFSFCLVVVKLDYSIVLGAFVIGAVMAEARQLETVERLVAPVRDMFSAIFFVSIGLLVDPQLLVRYAVPVAVITAAVVGGKVVSCTIGTMLGGHDGRTSLRVGMGIAQIGEFSFIIATLGMTLGVTSPFLYPIVVSVSAITTLFTPYLIRLADPLSGWAADVIPAPVGRVLGLYVRWLKSLQPQGDRAMLTAIVRRSLLQVLINCSLVTAIFLGIAYFRDAIVPLLSPFTTGAREQNAVLWAAALTLSLPFLVAVYRKLQGLSMVLADMTVKPTFARQSSLGARRVISEVIPVAAIAAILLLVSALSVGILPPTELLVVALALGMVLVVVLWRGFVKLHARLRDAFVDVLERKSEG